MSKSQTLDSRHRCNQQHLVELGCEQSFAAERTKVGNGPDGPIPGWLLPRRIPQCVSQIEGESMRGRPRDSCRPGQPADGNAPLPD